MHRVIYITSLGHSGSTLLSLILGKHSCFVGFGPIADILVGNDLEQMRQRGSVCTCGSRIDECSFWRKVASELEASVEHDIKAQYQKVLETVENEFGGNCIAVDSSKGIRPLKILHGTPNINVKVLYMIKDVRSYTVSMIDNAKNDQAKRKRAKKARNFIRVPDFARLSFYYFVLWYLKNKRIQLFLKKHNMQYFQLGYEELCLYPNLMIEKICTFLGEEPEPSLLSSLSIDNSRNHITGGNRMRRQSAKQQLSYDNRWFYRNEWLLPALVFPNIMIFNKGQVYRNTRGTIWEQ
jgi:hypothetical protein